MVEEAAQLRREQQELAQLQALQAEQDRLETERQKLAQAKLLALAPRPKQSPPAALAATPQPGAPHRPGTPFWVASARFNVSGGVFENKDFRLEGPDNIVTGRGSFSVAEDSINLNLNANMPGVPDVPIKVFGRLRDPEMNIRAGMLINNTIKEILGIPLKPIKFLKDLLF